MILLDTDVVSEPLRREPSHKVITWLDAQSLETLFLSAITVAELATEARKAGVVVSGAEVLCSLVNRPGPGHPLVWRFG